VAPIERFVAAARVDPEEATLAGTVSGVLYLMGGLTLASFVFLPGVTHKHSEALLLIAGGACAWALASIVLIRWQSAPWWLIHLSNSTGFGVIAVAIASSGGAVSPAWPYLFFVAVFAAYFYGRPVALVYLIGCVAIHALPLLYDSRATSNAFMAQYAIAAPAYLVFGAAILAGKGRMRMLRSRAEQLAAEQSALRRVATAVVSGEPAERVYEVVAFELAQMLGAGAAGIMRLTAPGETTVMGSWSDHPGGRYEPGTIVPVRSGSDVDQALATRRPVRIDAHPDGSAVDQLGYRSSIVAPIQVGGAVWGALAVAAERAKLTAEDEQRMTTFGDLLASAIANIEDRAKLAAQASTDPLTGLANHRTLQQRIAAELARSVRHGRPLSVAVIDIDHFKQINDVGGHEAGDGMLVSVAECLSRLARAGDTLGRAGGDEFAWVLPECDRHQALIAVERARKAIAGSAPRPYRITVSAGICDTSVTEDPAELMKLADGALYWSKAHGRDQCWIYDPDVVNELSAQERAERLERSQALLGLKALARAIDAKDPATQEHSERVAALAAKLARVAGWSPERAELLSEAALVHDVGKIGVSDVVLRKTEPLTNEERAEIETHAELSARIVEDVLLPEQVDWIRTHHERPDGGGYPRRLRAEEIPEGGALLAVADAWDVMIVGRPYSVPKSPREALAECVELIGRQFTNVAVDALSKVHGDVHEDVASLVSALG
jgi:diguanylate cyclase (GGDEF)-like protein/putative nucleotidyltransferase with HDIG domain